MTRTFSLRFAAAAALAGVSASAGAQDFATFPGGTTFHANDVTADGGVVVGSGYGPSGLAFRWTHGAQPEGTFETIGEGVATGVTDDGNTIVGFQADGDDRAFVWTDGGSQQILTKTFQDGSATLTDVRAFGVSADGTVIAGAGTDWSTGTNFAVRWAAGELLSLGSVPQGTSIDVNGISADGTTIIGGTSTVPNFNGEAFKWTSGTGMAGLPGLSTATFTVANAASADGSVIVGTANVGGFGSPLQAVRWVGTQDGEGLGALVAGGSSQALGVSDDGSVVVGAVTDPDTGFAMRAMRYTDENGMETVEDWLRRLGATITTDVTQFANATNANGSVVVGDLTDGGIFIARAPEGDSGGGAGGGSGGSGDGGGGSGGGDNGGGAGGGDTGSGGGDGGNGGDGGDGGNGGGDPEPGLITIGDLSQSLADAGATSSAVVSNFNTLLNGAGSRPLDRRADPEGSIFWATGDLGRADHGAQDGGFGLGELGIGRNFGAVQLNAAFGASRQMQNTALGGQARVDSWFAKLEAMSRLYGNADSGLWAVLTGAGARGTADIGRNYLANGGLVVASSGSTDVSGFGVRGRLQWDNAFAHMSPFAELSWSRACIDGYAESGGPFPATFNDQCGSETLARYGVDAGVPVTDRFRVTATLEGVHPIGSSPGATSGQVTGLGAFNLAAPSDDDFWARGGVGFEADLGSASMLSVMVNATTQGSAPSSWFSASWRRRF